jgi:general secretion pathway protein M
MIAVLTAWWRQRTGRERLLIQIAAALVALMIPMLLFAGAVRFKEAAEAELAAAQSVAKDVQWLAEQAPRVTVAEVEGGLQGAAIAAAEQSGVAIARIELSGPDRLRVVFVPANSLAIYRWIDAVGRRGGFVVRSAIVRRGDGDEVEAEFELAAGPS